MTTAACLSNAGPHSVTVMHQSQTPYRHRVRKDDQVGCGWWDADLGFQGRALSTSRLDAIAASRQWRRGDFDRGTTTGCDRPTDNARWQRGRSGPSSVIDIPLSNASCGRKLMKANILRMRSTGGRGWTLWSCRLLLLGWSRPVAPREVSSRQWQHPRSRLPLANYNNQSRLVVPFIRDSDCNSNSHRQLNRFNSSNQQQLHAT